MKVIFSRLVLFIFSLVISVSLSEFLIDWYIGRENLTKVYYSNRVSDWIEKSTFDKDQNYLRFTGKNKEVEILHFGDSFTNGGNVLIDHTYPSQLWKLLDGKYTIKNKGACESSTKQVFEKIQRFFEGPTYDSEKFYVVTVLAGAADQFFSRSGELVLEDMRHQVHFPTRDYVLKKPFWFEELFTYKMLKILIGKYLNLPLTRAKLIDAELASNYAHCFNVFKKDKHGLAHCLVTKKGDFPESPLERRITLLKQFLQTEFAFQSSMGRAQILDHLFLMINADSELISSVYNLWWVLALSATQQKYSILEISDFLERIIIEKIPPRDQLVLLETIQNFKRYHQSESRETEFYRTWTALHEYLKQFPAKLIVMTYPIDYRGLNYKIRNMSKQQSISLIDLETIFTKQDKPLSSFIDDWEHANPEGHKLIAQSLKDFLNELSHH